MGAAKTDKEVVRVRKMGGSLYIVLKHSAIITLGLKSGDYMIATLEAAGVVYRRVPLEGILNDHALRINGRASKP